MSAAAPDLLRVMTCGSVDDGKSTLIGRLLHDARAIADDTLAALVKDSIRDGTVGEETDLSLLVDGLEAERQQGITIDVAYRFFATPRRSFILADTPGHAQYTRNMATAASNSDLAILLLDARKGVLEQTRRHACICSLLGVRHVVLAINKIDLVDFAEAVHRQLVDDFGRFAQRLGFESVVSIPLSARFGDNVTSHSARTSWYQGPTLMAWLEQVSVAGADAAQQPFRLPVQWVNRPNDDFRGVAGMVAGGRIALGDAVVAALSGRRSRVARILGPDGDVPAAQAGDAVTVCLEDAVDVARGDILAAEDAAPVVADQFAANLIWMDDDAMLPGRQYLLRMGHAWTTASITSLKHRLDISTLEPVPAASLAMNDIGECKIAASQPLAFDAYQDNRVTGAFILVDRFTNRTAGAGMVKFALHRASNIRRETFLTNQHARAAMLGQRPLVLWFTGLSGAGKTTIARLVEHELHQAGRLTYVLDGDNLRHGLNRDLGFTAADRVENIRRTGEVAKLFADAGLIVLCSLISPFRAERQMVRDMLQPGAFIEVFVDTPLQECIRRDPKGLYAKAQRGEISNFTGISSPYEAPEAAELHLRTADTTPEALAAQVLAHIQRVQTQQG